MVACPGTAIHQTSVQRARNKEMSYTNRRIIRHHLPGGIILHGGVLVGCWLSSVHGSCWLTVGIHLTNHPTIRVIDALLSAIVDRSTMTLYRRLLAVISIIPGCRRVAPIARSWRNLNRLTLWRSSRDWWVKLVLSTFSAIVSYTYLFNYS